MKRIITKQQQEEIKKLYAEGWSQKRLSEKFGTRQTNISRILSYVPKVVRIICKECGKNIDTIYKKCFCSKVCAKKFKKVESFRKQCLYCNESFFGFQKNKYCEKHKNGKNRLFLCRFIPVEKRYINVELKPLEKIESQCNKEIPKTIRGHYCEEHQKFLKGLQGKDMLRELVRIRDNHTCQNCGSVWHFGKRRFDVHHLDESKEGWDYPKHNPNGNKTGIYQNDKKNLSRMITLCHRCHLSLPHIKEKMVNAQRKKYTWKKGSTLCKLCGELFTGKLRSIYCEKCKMKKGSYLW